MKIVVWTAVLIVFNFLLGIFLADYLPWWYIAITAVFIGYLSGLKSLQAWISGFMAAFLLWAGFSFFLDAQGGNILAPKMAELFVPITRGSTSVLFLFTGFIGGLASGFAMLTGTLLRNNFKK